MTAAGNMKKEDKNKKTINMKTINYLLLIITLPVMMFTVSCSKFDDDTGITGGLAGYGTPVDISLSMRVAGEQSFDDEAIPVTRAPIDTNQDDIYNVWVFQFNGDGDDALLVCPPYYIDEDAIDEAELAGAPLTMPLIDSEGAEHRLVFLANVNNKSYSWNMLPGKNTYQELISKHMVLTSENATYGFERKNLIMSGSVMTRVTPSVLVDGGDGNGVVMTRSLACVELNLSVDATKAPDFKVISVQMRNVSDRLDLFDNLKEISGIYPFSVSTLDYPVVKDVNTGLVTPNNPDTFVWFVPRNARGVGGQSTSPLTKNSHAPAGATFFEIVAECNSGNVVYRVYPGADDVSDFNIIPNHKYTVTLNIAGDGGANNIDSRIEQYTDVMFDGANNSFIINPPLDGMKPRHFSVPVTQVNRYWVSGAAGYGGLGANRIEHTDNWKVQLLWQDSPDIVRASDDVNYDSDSHITFTKDAGKGGDDWFTIKVPSDVPHGNFVVVIRKDDPDDKAVLWSWHLWVTDYAPNPKFINIRGDKFIYETIGGELHRYYGKRFGYPGNDSREWDGTTWDPVPSNEASMAQSFVMDRYIGMSDSENTSTTGRIYYQFGRKDPLPGNIPLYKIDGAPIGTTAPSDFPEQYWNGSTANGTAAPAGVNIVNSIYNPMRFFLTTEGSASWSGLNDTTFGWNDPNSDVANYITKSIYDPCPPGWRITGPGARLDFRHENTANNPDRGLAWNRGIKYYPYVKANGVDYTAPGYIFYPAIGYRYHVNGVGSHGGSHAYTWSSTPTSSSQGRYLDATADYVAPSSSGGRARGIPVRCASE